MQAASTVRHLYRIVLTNPPTLADFTSNEAAGRLPRRPLTDEQRRLWSGLSCTETLEQAQETARRNPALGAFVAVLKVPADSRVRIERAGRRDGHYTIWGDPALLLACVRVLAPV